MMRKWFEQLQILKVESERVSCRKNRTSLDSVGGLSILCTGFFFFPRTKRTPPVSTT